MEYLLIAGGLGLMAFLVWFAISQRRAGEYKVIAKTTAKTVETMKRQDEAAAKAPRSRDQVLDALEKGEF